MEQQTNFITQEGKEKLEKELRELIDIERPKTIKAIQEAREQGDLSENADYDAAKNHQAEIEGRIKEIQSILDRSEIIDEKANSEHKVKIGSSVTILDMSDDQTYTYDIVGEIESDPQNNKISNVSPLARALLGKSVGTVAEVHGVEDPYKVKIKKIA